MTSIWELFLKVLRGENEKASEHARNRLKAVLKQDRVKITPEAMEGMRADIVHTLSEYFAIEEDALELRIDQEGHKSHLVARIPIKGGRAEVRGKQAKPIPEARELLDEDEESPKRSKDADKPTRRKRKSVSRKAKATKTGKSTTKSTKPASPKKTSKAKSTKKTSGKKSKQS